MDPATRNHIQYHYENQYVHFAYCDGTRPGQPVENFMAHGFQFLQIGDQPRALPQGLLQAPHPGYYNHQPQWPAQLQIPYGGHYPPVPRPAHHRNAHNPSPHAYQDHYNPNQVEGYDESSGPYLSRSLVPVNRKNARIREWIDDVDASGPLKNPNVPSPDLASPHGRHRKDRKHRKRRHPSSSPARGRAATEFGEGPVANNRFDGYLHVAPSRPLDPSRIRDSISLGQTRGFLSHDSQEERVGRHHYGGGYYH